MNKKRRRRPLVVIEHLNKHYDDQAGGWRWFTATKSRKYRHALDDVNLTVYEGETLGLVGESGSGKTTLGRLMVRLLKPTSGSIYFQGRDISQLNSNEMQKLRRGMQIIFQDNLSSLNPRKTVRKILSQPFLTHKLLRKDHEDDVVVVEVTVIELLKEVGLSPPELYLDRYPHELSGGQRQRICIAHAIALRPKFIVADEPVSSLDIATRNQILNLMIKLKEVYELTYLFIGHDLSVIKSISDRVAVMYLGKIVEISTARDIFERPLHPYTIILLSSILTPKPQQQQEQQQQITAVVRSAEIPSSIEVPSGCRFHTRCPYVLDKCRYIEPQLKEVNEGHLVACHLIEEEK
ncbi:MAG: ABC transporter ATP-binding protein [Nitrososphaeraceae archaeon]